MRSLLVGNLLLASFLFNSESFQRQRPPGYRLPGKRSSSSSSSSSPAQTSTKRSSPSSSSHLSLLQRDKTEQVSIQGTTIVDPSKWDFVDAVYLITTTISVNTDRLERTKTQLRSVGLLDKLTIKTFKPDNEDRVRGCYTSHISVMQEIEKKMGKKKDYKVLILEDNLETTGGMSNGVLESIANFIEMKENWDVFHLAYMMYVPGLSLNKQKEKNVVQMKASQQSAVGTSAYMVSKSGVNKMLADYKQNKFTDAVPNIMAKLFPDSRYAAYPMVFHRTAKIGSLVNPQLDDFRKVMFNPALYTLWEQLMVTTGLQNNQLFPTLLISLSITIIATIYKVIVAALAGELSIESIGPLAVVVGPLLVGIWGASLFKTDKEGNMGGSGFAEGTQYKERKF